MDDSMKKVAPPPLVALQQMPQSALWHCLLDLLFVAHSDVAYEVGRLLTDLIVFQPDSLPQLSGAQVYDLWQRHVQATSEGGQWKIIKP